MKLLLYDFKQTKPFYVIEYYLALLLYTLCWLVLCIIALFSSSIIYIGVGSCFASLLVFTT